MKGIPSSQYVVVTILSSNSKTFYITTTALQDLYYIYEVKDNVATKLGSSKNPLDLENKYVLE